MHVCQFRNVICRNVNGKKKSDLTIVWNWACCSVRALRISALISTEKETEFFFLKMLRIAWLWLHFSIISSSITLVMLVVVLCYTDIIWFTVAPGPDKSYLSQCVLELTIFRWLWMARGSKLGPWLAEHISYFVIHTSEIICIECQRPLPFFFDTTV